MDKRYCSEEFPHVRFTKAFYDLPLYLKIAVVTPLLEAEVSYLTYDRIVKALLQHSSPELKKDFPCEGVRKLSKAAREADEAYIKLLQYAPVDLGE